jgi:hypothetical protein
LRDIVTRLLAYEASRSGNPEALFKEFMEDTDSRVDAFSADKPEYLRALEGVRMEVEFIIATARKTL